MKTGSIRWRSGIGDGLTLRIRWGLFGVGCETGQECFRVVEWRCVGFIYVWRRIQYKDFHHEFEL